MTVTTPILTLDNSYTFGGAINSLAHLLRALDKERFAPVLVTGQPPRWTERNFPGCTCYHFRPKLSWVDNRRYVRLAALAPFRLRWLRKGLNLARFGYWQAAVTLPEALRYYRLGRHHRVGLVHLNNILDSQLSGILAARLLGVPCIAHLRDFVEVHPLTRLYARHIDHHVAISGAIRDNLLALGVPEEKISVVHDAVDLERFTPDIDCSAQSREFGLRPDQPRFGIFGRVVEWKGIREFLLAARQVLAGMPSARAFVVGGASDGSHDFYRAMESLARELGIAGQVVFTGGREDIPALMRLMDVVVHASTRPEPFGMVVIEAMAMARPVVASGAGGPLDIVLDGTTGLLVEPGDAPALGRAIGRLLAAPELRRRFGEQGRLRVATAFSSDRYAAQMTAIYQRFCGGLG